MARMTLKDWATHEHLQAASLRMAGYLTEDEWYDEADAEGWEATAKAEAYNEAVLNGEFHYDPEAQDDLALHDFLHPDGYGV